MRRLALALVALALISGCGLGAGDERGGEGAELRVTRDFGRKALAAARRGRLRESDTVMRFLQSERKVGTRFGGRFVQSIDGLQGKGPEGRSDWFFFVNGLEAGKGAAEYELHSGDVVQWDYRRWDAAMSVPAIVGAYPEPLLSGEEGRRFPVRVECEKTEGDPCREIKRRLRDQGIKATGSSLGAPGTQDVARVVVGRWRAVRIVRAVQDLQKGPERSGVFARLDGDRVDLLGDDGKRVREAGPGTGIVAALRPREKELVWVVAGADDEGVRRAAEALNPSTLREAFAVAAGPGGPQRLPLEDK